jgi:hypothetical protein
MIIQLKPPLPLDTPKGSALCHFLIDEGIEHDLMWVCFIDSTGECWTFRNRQIKACKNITAGRIFETPTNSTLSPDITDFLARRKQNP